MAPSILRAGWRTAIVAGAAVVLAACGGSGMSAGPAGPAPLTTASSPTPSAPASGPAPARSSGHATYTIVLKDMAPSPPHAHPSSASITATLRVLAPQGELCWSFRKVIGVPNPTSAHINRPQSVVNDPDVYHTTPNVVVALGARYEPSGCTGIAAGLAQQLLTPTSDFYLAVDSKSFPNQTLRARLPE
jgi:hypothetical protein